MIIDLVEIRYLQRVSVFENKRKRAAVDTVHKVISDNREIPFVQEDGVVTLSEDKGENVYFQRSFYFSDAPIIAKIPGTETEVEWLPRVQRMGAPASELNDELKGTVITAKIDIQIQVWDGYKFSLFKDQPVNVWRYNTETKSAKLIWVGTTESIGGSAKEVKFRVLNRIRELNQNYLLSRIREDQFPFVEEDKIGDPKKEVFGKSDKVAAVNVDGRNRTIEINFTLTRKKEDQSGVLVNTPEPIYQFTRLEKADGVPQKFFDNISPGDIFEAPELSPPEDQDEIELDFDKRFEIELDGEKGPSIDGTGTILLQNENVMGRSREWLVSGNILPDRDYTIINIDDPLRIRVEKAEEIQVGDIVRSGNESRIVERKVNDQIILLNSFRDLPKGTIRVESLEAVFIGNKKVRKRFYQVERSARGTIINYSDNAEIETIATIKRARVLSSKDGILTVAALENVEADDIIKHDGNYHRIIAVEREEVDGVDQVMLYHTGILSSVVVRGDLVEIRKVETIRPSTEIKVDTFGGDDKEGNFIHNPAQMIKHVIGNVNLESFARVSNEANYRISYLIKENRPKRDIASDMNNSIHGILALDNNFNFMLRQFEVQRHKESFIADHTASFNTKIEEKTLHFNAANIKYRLGDETALEAEWELFDKQGGETVAEDMEIHLYNEKDALTIASSRVFYRSGISIDLEFSVNEELEITVGDTVGFRVAEIETLYDLGEIWGVVTEINSRDGISSLKINSASGNALRSLCIVDNDTGEASIDNIATLSHIVDNDTQSPLDDERYSQLGIIG